jgi:prophage antirepressor-like protein
VVDGIKKIMSKEKNEKNELDGNELSNFVQFKGQKVRRVIFNNEWWFSVVDVCGVLAESTSKDSGAYWRKLKQRLLAEGSEVVTKCHDLKNSDFQLSTICRQLKLESSDGKKYETDCANTEGLFRIIQSIPSPKAEPFKRWLAKVGYERIQEIADPELAMNRAKAIYEKKGYPKDWIDKRMRGIAVRNSLTDEWRDRGLKRGSEYAILTNEIMEGTFGLKVEDYKKVKGLERENLRDHMNDMELILTMLGEATTTEITKVRDSKGFVPLKKDAREGGDISGDARKAIEKKTGKKIVNPTNFLLEGK